MSAFFKLVSNDIHPELTQPNIRAVIARAGANALKTHFLAKNKQPNKIGAPRSNFWSRVRESVQTPRTSETNIKIMIMHPHFATHLYGAIIIPKNKPLLAIPISYNPLKIIFCKRANIPKDHDALPSDYNVIKTIDRALESSPPAPFH